MVNVFDCFLRLLILYQQINTLIDEKETYAQKHKQLETVIEQLQEAAAHGKAHRAHMHHQNTLAPNTTYPVPLKL